MGTRMKFCGMRRREDIEAVNRIRPDYIGFICTDRFWRYIPPEKAAELKAMLDPSIRAVGVFVDLVKAEHSAADYILLDNGAGTGQTFDWKLIRDIGREYFLAGGLTPENVGEAVDRFHPFAVDMSSGLETDRIKDPEKMRKAAEEVRKR